MREPTPTRGAPSARRRQLATVALLSVAMVGLQIVPATALAADEPAAALAPPAAATPAEAGVPDTASPAGAAAQVDPDDRATRARFQTGLDELREGNAAAAATLLGPVASASQLAERRAAAAALVAYARRLEAITRGGGGDAALQDLSDGRTEFIVTTTLASFYAGVVLIDVLNLDDDVRPIVGTLLVTTGGGLVASIFASRGLGLRAADGEAYSLGAIWGAATGGLLAAAAEVETSESAQLLVLGGLAAGAFTGLGLSRTYRPTRGQVGVISGTMPIGLATAMLGSVFLQDQDVNFKTITLIWLAGLQAGTFAGIAVAPDLDWSASRARLTLLSGGVGALVGWGLAALATGTDGDGSDTSKIWAGSALAGLWGGVALGAWLTEDMAPDPLYREPAKAPMAMVLPTRIGDGGGLAITGTF